MGMPLSACEGREKWATSCCWWVRCTCKRHRLGTLAPCPERVFDIESSWTWKHLVVTTRSSKQQSINPQNLPLQPPRQLLKPPPQRLPPHLRIIQHKRNNIPIDARPPPDRQIIHQPHKLGHPDPQLADLQVRQTTLLRVRVAERGPLPVSRRIDGAVARELQGAIDQVRGGLGLVGPEDGAVAVQEDGGDFAGVEEALRAGVLQGEAVLWRHCEVDVPDYGEEGGGAGDAGGDAQVGF